MYKKDLTKYDINTSKEKERKVYSKRYKENGEEYLKCIDKINIEEDMAEKKLEIERIKELINQQEILKAEQLLEEDMDEEFLENAEYLTQLDNLQTSEFLNKTAELKGIYNKMPKNIQEKYKNLSKFAKEFLPEFIEENRQKLEMKKQEQIKVETTESLEEQIAKLQEQLKGTQTNV